jgi:hypothetical protein
MLLFHYAIIFFTLPYAIDTLLLFSDTGFRHGYAMPTVFAITLFAITLSAATAAAFSIIAAAIFAFDAGCTVSAFGLFSAFQLFEDIITLSLFAEYLPAFFLSFFHFTLQQRLRSPAFSPLSPRLLRLLFSSAISPFSPRRFIDFRLLHFHFDYAFHASIISALIASYYFQ